MDYKKLIIYLIIIVVSVGLWVKSKTSQEDFQKNAKTFTSVYAASAVIAELYRNEPENYYIARDSIYRKWGVDSAWVFDFAKSLEGKEEYWYQVWDEIYRKVDSMAAYYKLNPIEYRFPVRQTADTLPSE